MFLVLLRIVRLEASLFVDQDNGLEKNCTHKCTEQITETQCHLPGSLEPDRSVPTGKISAFRATEPGRLKS